MKPFPLHGLVPMFKQMTRIEAITRHALLGQTYTLQTKDRQLGLIVHYNMTREQLIEQIDAYAAFGAGQRVNLERYGTKVIGHRRWSFKEGRAYYRIADERNKVASGWIPEERLKQMVENARQMDRTTEAERQNDLEASL